MADTSGAEFTVRLLNQVTAPARQIQAAMNGVDRAFKSTKRTLDAPNAKRGGLSDWDKMVSKAKLSQVKDFAAEHKRLTDSMNKPQGAGAFGAIAGELGLYDLAKGAVESVYGAVWEGIKAVGRLGLSFLEAAESAAEFGQKSVLAISFLTNDSRNAVQAFDNVRTMAQGLGLDVNETVHSFERMLAMQFTVGKSTQLIKMAADMQAIGAGAEEVQRILYAISEIKSMGTLQKRQERMLQMAGISGQLIDDALQKRMGLKDHAAVESARKKNKIGADVAIDAIMEAVMHKTHESKLGDAGKAFADSTISGMRQEFASGVANFFTDVGALLLPGMVQIAQLVKGTVVKLVDNPALKDFGNEMLIHWGRFVTFVTGHWPQIESMLVLGLGLIVGGMRLLVSGVDFAIAHWSQISLVLEGFAVLATGAVLAIGAVIAAVMTPFALASAVIGGIVGAVANAVEYLAAAVPRWFNAGKAMVGGLIAGMLSMLAQLLSVVAVMALPVPALAGIAGYKAGSALIGAHANGSATALGGATVTTEAGKQTSGKAVSINSLAVHVTPPANQDPSHWGAQISAAVHTELVKLLHEHT